MCDVASADCRDRVKVIIISEGLNTCSKSYCACKLIVFAINLNTPASSLKSAAKSIIIFDCGARILEHTEAARS